MLKDSLKGRTPGGVLVFVSGLAIALSVLEQFSPFSVLVSCERAAECSYFSGMNLWPWWLLEQPLVVILLYTIVFASYYGVTRGFGIRVEWDQVFKVVMLLYPVEIIGISLLFVVLYWELSEIRAVVLVIPYAIYLAQAAAYCAWLRCEEGARVFALVPLFFLLRVASEEFLSAIYDPVVHAYLA
jgi:hypothetical protein